MGQDKLILFFWETWRDFLLCDSFGALNSQLAVLHFITLVIFFWCSCVIFTFPRHLEIIVSIVQEQIIEIWSTAKCRRVVIMAKNKGKNKRSDVPTQCFILSLIWVVSPSYKFLEEHAMLNLKLKNKYQLNFFKNPCHGLSYS